MRGSSSTDQPTPAPASSSVILGERYLTGTLAIDYRGKGDPAEGIAHTRAILEAAIGPEAAKE